MIPYLSLVCFIVSAFSQVSLRSLVSVSVSVPNPNCKELSFHFPPFYPSLLALISLDKLAKGEIAVQLLWPTQILFKHACLLYIVPVILALYCRPIGTPCSFLLGYLLQKLAVVRLKACGNKLNHNV